MENETLWPSLKAPLPPISDEEFAEFEFYLKEENAWKDSLPNYSFHQLMQIFPEAVSAARRGLKLKLKQAKVKLREIQTWEEEHYDNIISKAHFSEQAELKEESDKQFEELRKQTQSQIRKIIFNLSYLDEMQGKAAPKKMGGVSEAEVARAKEISITNFYNDKLHVHGKMAVGRCPFHNEKTGSFTIYLDQNTFWCYGCQSGGTVVDFVMRQQNVDFLTAVKQLIKK